MRTLALDIGDARIGIAVSDRNGRVATPLSVIDARDMARARRELHRLVDEYEVEQFLVGLPLSLSGEEGPQARHVRSQAQRLLQDFPIPSYYHDERLTSVAAHGALRGSGLSERESKGKVDMIAATLFLQAWLDIDQESHG